MNTLVAMAEACRCCDCLLPTPLYRFVGASKSKTGYLGFLAGSVRSYLRTTYSGTFVLDESYLNGTGESEECPVTTYGTYSHAISGSILVDKENGVISDTTNCHIVTSGYDTLCTGVENGSSDIAPTSIPCGHSGLLNVLSDTARSWVADHISEPHMSGSQTETLSDEYTTSMLIAYVESSLPDWPEAYTAAPLIAYRDLSDDELTYTIARVRYRFRFPVPKSSRCYKVSWNEHFVPEDGSDAIDTPRAFTWDGEIPDDYDPDDELTWPLSPEFELLEGGVDGITTITDIEVVCSGCA